MKIKYFFSLYFLLFLTSGFALADNPGEVVAQADDVAEEVVAETEAESAQANDNTICIDPNITISTQATILINQPCKKNSS